MLASVTVRNIGAVPGEEVVQLYIGDPVASRSRPVRELKGFRRSRSRLGKADRSVPLLQLTIYDISAPTGSPRRSMYSSRENSSSASAAARKLRHKTHRLALRQAMTSVSDDALLDLVQRQTLRYFWDFGHPD